MPIEKSKNPSGHDFYYAYVPHHLTQKWEDAGWSFYGFVDSPDCVFSSIYVWDGAGDPVFPEVIISIQPKPIIEREGDE